MKKILSAFALTAFLTGCGGGPSDAEIKSLYSSEITKANKRMIGEIDIIDIVNHGCESHETMEGAYSCDLEVTLNHSLTGENTGRNEFTLGKSKSGEWYFIN